MQFSITALVVSLAALAAAAPTPAGSSQLSQRQADTNNQGVDYFVNHFAGHIGTVEGIVHNTGDKIDYDLTDPNPSKRDENPVGNAFLGAADTAHRVGLVGGDAGNGVEQFGDEANRFLGNTGKAFNGQPI